MSADNNDILRAVLHEKVHGTVAQWHKLVWGGTCRKGCIAVCRHSCMKSAWHSGTGFPVFGVGTRQL